jgi:hypothetical protein
MNIVNVNVNCSGGSLCEDQRDVFSTLRGRFENYDHLKTSLRYIIDIRSIVSFNFELRSLNLSDYELDVSLRIRPLITRIDIRLPPERKLPLTLQGTTLAVGDFYNADILPEVEVILDRTLKNIGFPSAKINFRQKEKSGGVHLIIDVNPGRPVRIERVNVNFLNQSTEEEHPVLSFLSNRMKSYQGRIYNNENLSEDQVTYTPVSGVYNAIVRHKKNNKFEFLPETRAVFFDGDIAIKVKQDARDYILQGRTENITINNRKYTVSSDEWVQNFLGLKYYYFGLKAAN